MFQFSLELPPARETLESCDACAQACSFFCFRGFFFFFFLWIVEIDVQTVKEYFSVIDRSDSLESVSLLETIILLNFVKSSFRFLSKILSKFKSKYILKIISINLINYSKCKLYGLNFIKLSLKVS